MTPVPPVDLVAVILTALFNPVVIVVAFWMGRKADQPQKLPVAAFAAALAGSLARLHRGAAGADRRGPGRARRRPVSFIAQFVFGLVWAYLGHRFFRR